MFHNFSLDDQHFDDFFHSHKSNACLISSVSNYDLGGAGHLFKAPQPIIEQPLDHMISSISRILFGEDLISQKPEFAYIESSQIENSISNIFHEFEEVLANKLSSPSHTMNSDGIIIKENLHPIRKFPKSVSSDCLTSKGGSQIKPTSVSYTEMKEHGMCRAFSEGCIIKPKVISDPITETRMQKLSRYRDKKAKRNFKRKIKYACRKALADGQPRIRGRFAKTEETANFNDQNHNVQNTGNLISLRSHDRAIVEF